MAGVGLAGTGKTGMDKGDCWGISWIMKTDRQTEPERAQQGMCEGA